MRKFTLIFLIAIVLMHIIFLIVSLTNKSTRFFQYRLIAGISFLIFSGMLRQHILSYNKNQQNK